MMDTHHCPVCGMVSTDSNITKIYSGVSYHLCSQQCQQNFTKQPTLYLGIHAEKYKRKSIVKKRTFTLDSPLLDAEVETLEPLISAMMGVRKVQISGAAVSVSYDLLEATAEQVEKTIEQAGNKLGNGWSARLKRGWVHYTEETELDNLATDGAACCNKPPAKG